MSSLCNMTQLRTSGFTQPVRAACGSPGACVRMSRACVRMSRACVRTPRACVRTPRGLPVPALRLRPGAMRARGRGCRPGPGARLRVPLRAVRLGCCQDTRRAPAKTSARQCCGHGFLFRPTASYAHLKCLHDFTAEFRLLVALPGLTGGPQGLADPAGSKSPVQSGSCRAD